MRIYLFILSLFLLSATHRPVGYFAPSPLYVYRYFTTTDKYGASFNVLVYMPIDSISSGKKKPVIFYFPGSGETGAGSNLANANKYGPTREVALGTINGRVKQGSDSVLPIRIVIQRNVATTRDTLTYAQIEKMITLYTAYIDTFQMHVIGVSLGGITGGRYLANTSKRSGFYRFASITMLSPGGVDTATNNNKANFANYALAGGHMLMMTGAGDNGVGAYHPVASGWLTAMYAGVAGSAVGRDWTVADSVKNLAGTVTTVHEGWNTVMSQFKLWNILGNRNIEEWQLSFNRAPVIPPTPLPNNYWKKKYQRIKLIQ